MRSWQTGFVLGVASNSTVGGTVIQYQTDTDQLAQKWAIDPVTTTTFLVRNLNSDMCINVVGTGANGEIQQRPCDSRWDEQIFQPGGLEQARPLQHQERRSRQVLPARLDRRQLQRLSLHLHAHERLPVDLVRRPLTSRPTTPESVTTACARVTPCGRLPGRSSRVWRVASAVSRFAP
ncbi:RICIN domain-containing protein [Kitasatospora sp. NPDC091335]|uniref:RICIN domain-containing protein n=1 Tax=Kitasatospora sp. NPDC091335 TaxID=3364085 RepID=UPI0038029800